MTISVEVVVAGRKTPKQNMTLKAENIETFEFALPSTVELMRQAAGDETLLLCLSQPREV